MLLKNAVSKRLMRISGACLMLLLLSLTGNAQERSGIKFENGLSWAKIKEKAKEEHKYIFMDIYTTWCVPCKEMSANVFPQPQVGDLFNKNFINIAVQFDVTKADDDYVKSWYADVKMLHDLYKIDSYPTYLFFNPDGQLVHFTKGGSNATDFIANAKDALDPKMQYVSIKTAYAQGKRDQAFLMALIVAAKRAGDILSMPDFINSYLVTQDNLLTKQNIEFIGQSTSKSTDIGYRILIDHPKEADAVIGKKRRAEILKVIAFDEEVLPLIRIGGKKTVKGGGMVIYEGKVDPNADWAAIEKKIDLKYKDIADVIIVDAKTTYYSWTGDWDNFNKALLAYTSGKNAADPDIIDAYAGRFIAFCDDVKYYDAALKWSAGLIKSKENPYHLKTYSRLLYKAGKAEAAIKVMQEYVGRVSTPDNAAIDTIEKMKKGEQVY